MESYQRLPQKVKLLLGDYFKKVQEELPGCLEGFFLTGSLALGAYHEGKSDIDFIGVSDTRFTTEEVKKLENIHKAIKRKYPKNIFDGAYILWEDIGRSQREVGTIPYFYQGKMHLNDKFGDINMVTWYVIKKYGISLKDFNRKRLDFELDYRILEENMFINLNTYWSNWRKNIIKGKMTKRIYSLLDDGVVWGALGISRLYYTFLERDIVSKDRAGEYALLHVPQEHHDILKEALRLRKGEDIKYFSSPFKRRRALINYMGFIIGECNEIVRNNLIYNINND